MTHRQVTRRSLLQGFGAGAGVCAVLIARYAPPAVLEAFWEDKTPVEPLPGTATSFDLSGAPALTHVDPLPPHGANKFTMSVEPRKDTPQETPTPTLAVAEPTPAAPAAERSFDMAPAQNVSASDLISIDRQARKTTAGLPATRGLWLVNEHTNESISTVFWQDGQFNNLAYSGICELMRDWRENITMAMDPRLLHLLWTIQREIAFSDPIVIHSGFRSIKTNDMLRAEGAAVNSQHLHSRACDITIANVPPRAVALKAQALNIGGIGFYERFTHVDTGPVRQWSA